MLLIQIIAVLVTIGSLLLIPIYFFFSKSFLVKFLLCLAPCVIAGWITTVGIHNYLSGDTGQEFPFHNNIKLGTDLAGGTILIYEIDLKKMPEGDKGDPRKAANLLAEALKRRIDPNDLYNIVIRPAGGEGRVEIILPTGGVYRMQKAEDVWKELLRTMEEKYKLPKGELEVGRGETQRLIDRIQLLKSENKWKEIFSHEPQWKELLTRSYDRKNKNGWGNVLDPEIPGSGRDYKLFPAKSPKLYSRLIALKMVSPNDTKGFQPLIDVLRDELAKVNLNVTDMDIKNYIKSEAWRQLLKECVKKWPEITPYEDELMRIPPDSHEQLIGFINADGNVMAQAMVNALAPIMGPDILVGKDFPDRKKVKEFVDNYYGPSVIEIRTAIKDRMKELGGGQGLDLTVEEVQRIKELVSKVGSLEFLMLANSKDDEKAEKEEERVLNQPDDKMKAELAELQKDGLPPPGPRMPNSKKLEIFTVDLHNTKSRLTYRWVELGPQERRALGLDNNAEIERERGDIWQQAKLNRDKAIRLKDRAGRELLQGALFFSRECINRNLPEEERRNKKVEYFVLARNPELGPNDEEGKKIDGSLLAGAQSGISNDFRPAVHFQFNTEGGQLFGALTGKNIPSEGGNKETQVRRHLAIILDGLVMSAPTIQSQITTNGQISGSFTQKEVDSLVNILRSGALPATLKPQPVSESTMGPTIGLDTIKAGLTAVVGAFVIVLVFMIIYYRFAGGVASVALLANLLLTVGFMISVQATFTLPGLAGLVLMVGMAVDANVLIYERLREERDRGASLALAIRNGYDRALPIIIDTHLTGIFTAVVLYVVGNDQLRGFGVSLTIGLLISLFTSLFITRVIFDFWLSKHWLHKLSMFRMFSKPNLDFMGIRNIMFAATLTLAVLGITLFIGRLPNDLNIDFVGGVAFGGQLEKPVLMDELRKKVNESYQEEKLKGVEVKEVAGSEGHRFQLKYPGDKESRIITLVEAPKGDKEQREKEVALRASKLPDPAVEQIFPSSDQAEDKNKSRHFTIRTSENEPELVQAVLDRLLEDDSGRSMMQRVYLKIDPLTSRGTTKLNFYLKSPKDFPPGFSDEADLAQPDKDKRLHTPASPSFVRTLIHRHLDILPMFHDKKADFDLPGEGYSSEGRYNVMNFALKGEIAQRPLSGEEIKAIQNALEAARQEFEARPQPERLEKFDSQLATETQFRAMWAIVASWGAILLYLWFRFASWTFGLAAVICLIHDLFFTLGAIAACHFIDNTFLGHILGLEDFKIDLPAVAALLTLVGYSVNDTIVVFDRIREVRGKNPDLTPKMINDSINQTLSRTLLTSLATWLVVIVLYIAGGPGIHLFAFVMVIGVVVGTYSSIYIASPLLLIFGEGVHGEPARTFAAPSSLATAIEPHG